MADNLVGEDLDVILDLPENDCLDDDQDIQGAFLTAAKEVCFLFTIKFTVDLVILLSDLQAILVIKSFDILYKTVSELYSFSCLGKSMS